MSEALKTENQTGSVTRPLHRIRAMIWRVWRGANKAILHKALPLLAKPQPGALLLERIGSDYGGWTIPADLIHPDWICYCIGVGIDASFDFGLVKRFGCSVFSMDPTPKAVQYMAKENYDRSKLTFLPIGIWTSDTQLRFYEPANPLHASNLSTFDLHGTGRFVTAECKSLPSIMNQLGHTSIQLMKLDVEGAWRDVVDKMIADRLVPPVFCVEMDSPVSLKSALNTIGKLKKIGMQLVHVEKDNYLFVATSLMQAKSSLKSETAEPVTSQV